MKSVRSCHIIRRLAEKFGKQASEAMTSSLIAEKEEDDFYYAFESILDSLQTGEVTLQIEESFEYDDNEFDGCEKKEDDPDWKPEPEERNSTPIHQQIRPETCEKAIDFWKINQSPKKTAIALGWRLPEGLQRVKNIIRNYKLNGEGGSQLYRYEQIRKYVKLRFDEARSECRIVNRDSFDIWIRAAVVEYKPSRPCSSRSYFDRLKRDLCISSRRITKFVTKSVIKDEEKLKVDAAEFVKQTNRDSLDQAIPHSWVLNSDQTGFGFEPVSEFQYKNEFLTLNINFILFKIVLILVF